MQKQEEGRFYNENNFNGSFSVKLQAGTLKRLYDQFSRSLFKLHFKGIEYNGIGIIIMLSM